MTITITGEEANKLGDLAKAFTEAMKCHKDLKHPEVVLAEKRLVDCMVRLEKRHGIDFWRQCQGV